MRDRSKQTMSRARVFALVCAAALVGVACSDHSPQWSATHPTAAADAWDGLELARIGTVGVFPAEDHVLVRVAADGSLACNGVPVPSYRALGEALAASMVWDERWGPSRVAVVIAADARAAWRHVCGVLQTCTDPAVRASRVFFACRHEQGGAAGAFAMFMPEDCLGEDPETPHGRRCATVRIRRAAGVADPLAITEWLAATPSDERPAVELDAAPDAPFGVVLRAADAAARGGAPALFFRGIDFATIEGAGGASQPSDTASASLPWTISVRGIQLSEPVGAAPVPAQVTDAVAGFARTVDSHSHEYRPDYQIEPDEPDEPDEHAEPSAPTGPR